MSAVTLNLSIDSILIKLLCELWRNEKRNLQNDFKKDDEKL